MASQSGSSQSLVTRSLWREVCEERRERSKVRRGEKEGGEEEEGGGTVRLETSSRDYCGSEDRGGRVEQWPQGTLLACLGDNISDAVGCSLACLVKTVNDGGGGGGDFGGESRISYFQQLNKRRPQQICCCWNPSMKQLFFSIFSLTFFQLSETNLAFKLYLYLMAGVDSLYPDV